MNKPHIRLTSRGAVVGFGKGAPFLFISRGATLAQAWEGFVAARQVAWAFALNGYTAR